MKKLFVLAWIGFFFLLVSGVSYAAEPSVLGVWSVPGIKGAEKSKEKWQLEIYEKDGTIEGKYVKLSTLPQDAVCKKCKKEREGQPLLGMVILYDMKRQAKNVYKGKVYDVEQGKSFSCTVSLRKPDMLEVQACWLFSICESYAWTRVK